MRSFDKGGSEGGGWQKGGRGKEKIKIDRHGDKSRGRGWILII